jgi:HPt (histidine-containing phosphotransfer) domain-containing protein
MTNGEEGPFIDISVLEALEADTSRELVPELVAVFIKSANERRAHIGTHIEAGDLDGIAAQSHALKSSSATFGAMEVRRVSADLEAAGKAGDRTACKTLADELGRALDTAIEALNAYTSKLTG